jgi:hypothetical protein
MRYALALSALLLASCASIQPRTVASDQGVGPHGKKIYHFMVFNVFHV